MDWKLIATVFISIFLAELGDKTQLAVLSFSASSNKWLEVFLGASVAFVVITLIGAFFGTTISRYIDSEVVGKIAGIIFILIGIKTLIK
ncbi:MAG: TMEM165/GDT1 family protein [candidate division WOR-3 bacterium]